MLNQLSYLGAPTLWNITPLWVIEKYTFVGYAKFNSWVQVANNILQVKGQLHREHAQL